MTPTPAIAVPDWMIPCLLLFSGSRSAGLSGMPSRDLTHMPVDP